MAFTEITVTGTFKSPTGSAASGTVTFTLTRPMEQPGVGIVEPTPIVASLSAGAISQVLYATDDTDTTEAGSVFYSVEEQIVGLPSRSYTINVPHSAADGTVDLSTLAP